MSERLSAAETCRRNGWGVGTKLAGDEGHGETVIVITAIGERAILARAVSHDGKSRDYPEASWVLHCRDWKETA